MFEISAKNCFCDVISGDFRQWRKHFGFGSALFTQFWRCKYDFVYFWNVQRTFKDGKIKSTVFTRPHAMKRHKLIIPIFRNRDLQFWATVSKGVGTSPKVRAQWNSDLISSKNEPLYDWFLRRFVLSSSWWVVFRIKIVFKKVRKDFQNNFGWKVRAMAPLAPSVPTPMTVDFEIKYFLNEETEGVLTDTAMDFQD